MSKCIIIPVYKNELSEEELASLNNLDERLPDTPKYIIRPKSCEINIPLKVYSELPLDDKHFTGLISYSRLLMSSWFWESFKDYDHALIHQLDCWVYGDEAELDFWCKLNYSFVGAPHFKGYSFEKNPSTLQDTMNGGFSLRKIALTIEVLKAIENSGFNVSISNSHEDVFFMELFKGVAVARLPDPMTAARFSIEQGAEVLYPAIAPYKPFGLHAYVKHNSLRGR